MTSLVLYKGYAGIQELGIGGREGRVGNGQEYRNQELYFSKRGYAGIQELGIDKREEDRTGIQELGIELFQKRVPWNTGIRN